jgi:hypothetical protein
MDLSQKDPVWRFAMAWAFGLPVLLLLGGVLWSMVACDEQSALCRGGMQWYVIIAGGAIMWFVGLITIAMLLAVTSRRKSGRN